MPFAEVNGTTLYYESVGQGTPIVFVHPILLTGEVFSYQRASLSNRYQIITLDIRGHGNSRFSTIPLTYSMIAADIRQLLDTLGIAQAYLCGYSTGGQIALEALLTDPHRYLGAVLLGTMPKLTDPIQRSLVWIAHRAFGLNGKRLVSAIDAGSNADTLQMFKILYKSCTQGNMLNMAQYHEQVLGFNCTDRLHEIQAPVLLLYGQRDTRCHRYARIMQTRLPNSSVHFIRGAPHQIPTKHAADLDGLMRLWLADKAIKLPRERHVRKEQQLGDNYIYQENPYKETQQNHEDQTIH